MPTTPEQKIAAYDWLPEIVLRYTENTASRPTGVPAQTNQLATVIAPAPSPLIDRSRSWPQLKATTQVPGPRPKDRLRWFAVFGWPLLCIALLVMRQLEFHSLPWLAISAPLWVPVVSVAVLLLATMWLDQLSSQLDEQ